MNLDKKLELAHEYVLRGCVPNHNNLTTEGVAEKSWAYADAMEAEYNKRKKIEEK